MRTTPYHTSLVVRLFHSRLLGQQPLGARTFFCTAVLLTRTDENTLVPTCTPCDCTLVLFSIACRRSPHLTTLSSHNSQPRAQLFLIPSCVALHADGSRTPSHPKRASFTRLEHGSVHPSGVDFGPSKLPPHGGGDGASNNVTLNTILEAVSRTFQPFFNKRCKLWST